jgi:recombinational DNA repair ATPase RecF
MTSSTPKTESRLSHRIKSVSIRRGFLDGAKIEFSEGLNCFIGGRGTGKTTVLE